jgi:hypothetical protein
VITFFIFTKGANQNMNTFNRKALTTAVLAGLGVAGAAQAAYQNPSGLGQALIYPYYTVQSSGGNAYNTYVSVVNTTDRVKVVKVRFREGKNSREVLDFNLYLSPNDMLPARWSRLPQLTAPLAASSPRTCRARTPASPPLAWTSGTSRTPARLTTALATVSIAPARAMSR